MCCGQGGGRSARQASLCTGVGHRHTPCHNVLGTALQEAHRCSPGPPGSGRVTQPRRSRLHCSSPGACGSPGASENQ